MEPCQGCEQQGHVRRVGERWRRGACEVCQCLDSGTVHCSPYCPLGSCPQVRCPGAGVSRVWEESVWRGQFLGDWRRMSEVAGGLNSVSCRAGSWWKEWENHAATVPCLVSGSGRWPRSPKGRKRIQQEQLKLGYSIFLIRKMYPQIGEVRSGPAGKYSCTLHSYLMSGRRTPARRAASTQGQLLPNVHRGYC